ncbi:histidine--tRNA ligase [Truepera radiovictrix]|uniref:Histidine--tRNA ligase n=1 Tax=Truepera radiovictrix (strain DSM 17093 / CIP 108686 / LMG 22925 / RQ-24) TaxID=649638 RepID=D7CQA5_TRURR|nr:histidine--tRNA ligase [Truepera radiovictrix]ADI14889.1 histidyl-tRNA synthetase [Truepera radiovictrix DSM 17093]WMT56560.1 histidine--tRNA ligase [Truepera radiovictrix]
MKLRAVKGTFDILPEDQRLRRHVLSTAERVLEHAGVLELTPPIFEHTEVFTKSVGASSDLVVQHEMYTFTDRGERSLTLRPEFTAGVLRAYIENGLIVWPTPVKLWSYGPIFRAENPQRGRFRQFHQVNCEFLGLDTPLLDAEAIALLYTVLSACGLEGLTVRLGSVGDPEDAAAYNAYLRRELGARQSELSETSRERLRLNPMRVLDSKDAGDQAVIATLKRPLDFLNPDARAHFEGVQAFLTTWGIPFEVDDSIVRGLDYYRRTAFEIHAAGIGAQSALCGGGRYDGLVAALGGPETPGVGWAFGLERVLDALREAGVRAPEAARPALFLVPMDDEAVAEVAALAFRLRQNLTVLHAYAKRNLGKGFKEAERAGARFAGLRGARERERGVYALKDLATGEQLELPEGELAGFLHERLERPLASSL